MKKGGNGLVHLSLPIKSTHLTATNKKTTKYYPYYIANV